MSTRSVIIASAGSGKTFTLANRLIGWMVHRLRTEGDPGCDRLLASTFTRKAAGEILERVLQHLAQAVLDPGARDRYQQSFRLEKPPTADELRSVLIGFIRLLHRVQINTLDGVFHRICQCFPSEIGLPANWGIAESSSMDRLRTECVNEVLDTADHESMALLLKLMQRGRRQRSVHGTIMKKIWGGGYGTELLQLIRATGMAPDPVSPWNWLAPSADGTTLDGGRRLDAIELGAAAERLSEVSLPLTKAGTISKRWTKALKAMLDDLEDGAWETFLARGMTARCSIRQGETYYGDLPPADMVEAVEPLVVHAKAECILQRHEELQATRSILTAIEAVYRRRQHRAGLYTFGDIEQLLAEAGIVRAESLGALWFRLDGMIRDLAFDEFQDTSTRQFEVLDPLIEEVLSGEGGDVDRGFLLLADPKQSIYGWRGGTPSLVDRVESTYAGRLDEESSLVRSWRSSSVVLKAVDMVFGALGDSEVLASIDHAADGASIWLRRYSPHEAARDLPGFVEVRVPEAVDDIPGGELAIAETVRLIAQRRDVAPASSIGILVSRNDTATRIVAALRKAGIDASEEGSSLVVDSPAVLAMLSLLHLAEHPGDIRSLFHVASTPLGSLDRFWKKDAVGPIEALEPGARSKLAQSVSRGIRSELLAMGYGGFVHSVVEQLAGTCTSRDMLRLRQLVELAEAWEPRTTLEPGDFIRFIEGTPRSTTSMSAVCVMTVHKAKGLEFDEVVLPELTRNFKRLGDTVFLHHEDPAGPPTRVVPVLNQDVCPYFPTIFEECGAPRMHELVQDTLSVLYVAMTRARHALHMIMLPLEVGKESDPLPTTATGLLRSVLPGLDPAMRAHEEREDHSIWSIGDPEWSSHVDPVDPPSSRSSLSRPGLAARSRPRRARVAPSSRGERSLQELLGPGRFGPRIGADRGTLLHELFSHVGWIEDGSLSKKQEREAFDSAAKLIGAPVSVDRGAEALSAFHGAIKHEAVSYRLSREAYADRPHDELQLWRERSMQVQREDEVIIGRFDRVVVGLVNGKPAWADIIDYKSDRVGEDGGAAILARYAPQLETYVDAVCAMLDLEPRDVTSRLLLIGPGIDLTMPAS